VLPPGESNVVITESLSVYDVISPTNKPTWLQTQLTHNNTTVAELTYNEPSSLVYFNPSDCRCNYSATSNDMKLVHWPSIGGLLHLLQRGGDWAGPQPAQAFSRCTKCNSPPINGQCTNNRPLLCVLIVALKGLTRENRDLANLLVYFC